MAGRIGHQVIFTHNLDYKKNHFLPRTHFDCKSHHKFYQQISGSEEGVERIFDKRRYTTQVLPRDKLVGVLHKHILDNFKGKIELHYGYEVKPENLKSDENNLVSVRISRSATNEYLQSHPDSSAQLESEKNRESLIFTNLLIAADGTARAIANEMERYDKAQRKTMNFFQKIRSGKPFEVRRYFDDNQRVYKTIPMKLPSSWRPDFNYSARTKKSRIVIDALPADKNGNYCGVMLLNKDDSLAAPDTDVNELQHLLDASLPELSSIIDHETLAAVAKKAPSYLPGFRYITPRLHQGDRTLILGDAAHTVKPYFGLGANSALDDVTVFDECIESTSSIEDAVHLYSKKRTPEAEALVKISRELDRPGKLGLITFIIPLILDSIFHKFSPKLFAPGTITMLQNHEVSFQGVRRRKMLDRLGQSAVGISIFAALYSGFCKSLALRDMYKGTISEKIVRRLFYITVSFLFGQKLLNLLNQRETIAKKIG